MSDPQAHYFSHEPGVASARRTNTVVLSDLTLKLETDAGVFSGGQLDRGTRILLESAPRPPRKGAILDLGCGYGPIALTVASRSKDAAVWAVDINSRALDLVRDNAATAGLANVTAARPEDVPADVEFAAIYSNPPIRVGKASLHALLELWLPRLAQSGAAYLVVQKNLGSDSLAEWLNGAGFPTERLTSEMGYRILKTTRPAAADGK